MTVSEVYSDPSGGEATPGYANRRDYTAAEAIPVVIDGMEMGRLEVKELLP